MGLIIHVDGGSRGDPGPAGAGVVIQTEVGALIHEGGYFLGQQTNDAAEYHAVIRALKRARRCEVQPLQVCLDSQSLVRQITGEYEVKSPKLARLHQQVQMLLLGVQHWSFRHIPPDENRRANELANLAMDRQEDVVVFDVDSGGGESAEATAESPAGTTTPPAEAPDDTPVPIPLAAAPAHAVRVTLAQAPSPEVCSVGGCSEPTFTVQSVLPAGLCVYAAHAILPTVLAMLHTEPQEFAGVPTLTVRCERPDCGAVFHLSPVRSPNGARRRKEP